MCIMEVRPGQHVTTILQAMAHNTNTIIGDMDLLSKYADAHNDDETRRIIREASAKLNATYAVFLGGFGDKLALDVQDPNGHWHNAQPHTHGTERTFAETVNAATKRAHPYETR